MVDIKQITNVQAVGKETGRTDSADIDFQLKEIMDMIISGRTTVAMIKCANLAKRYKDNKQASQKIADFMSKFRLPNLRGISCVIQVAGDNVKHSDVLQEIIYRQPLGEDNKMQLSLKYFDKDKISGTLGFERHKGGFLDSIEYNISAEASVNSGDPKTSVINPLSLFKTAASARYYSAYFKGYAGYNLDVGFYRDGQLGLTYNGFNVGVGYAYFPYFNTYNRRVENSKGYYAEIGKYFQLGEKIGLYGFTKIPAGTLEPGQLPLYFAFNLKVKMNEHFAVNLQSSYFYTENYMQGMGGLGFDINF